MRDLQAQKKYNNEWRELRRKQGIRYVHGIGYRKIDPCEVCGERDIDIIDAHHIIPRKHNFSENVSRDKSDTIYLCQNCHKKLHKLFGGNGLNAYTGPTIKKDIIAESSLSYAQSAMRGRIRRTDQEGKGQRSNV